MHSRIPWTHHHCPTSSPRPRRLHATTSKLGPSSHQEHAADTDKKSEEYSDVMSARMGASLTYRHEDGMNYNRILDNIIVGSCLQTPEDANLLAEEEDVKTILCLQEDSDMAYFSLDVAPIRQEASLIGMQHLRHAIRDFDPYSLRRRLPGAVALFTQAMQRNGGTGYVHCTAGLGRAPAAALAYMWWVEGIPLHEAYSLLTSIRPCKPKADAIREAAVDLLYGNGCIPVKITVLRRGTAEKVEMAGMDVGWGQSVPLTSHHSTNGHLTTVRSLPPGKFQFKFIWDGVWGPCLDHLTMVDGDNLNNYIIVPDADMGKEAAAARRRIRSADGDLTGDERETIRKALAEMRVDGDSCSAPADLGGDLS